MKSNYVFALLGLCAATVAAAQQRNLTASDVLALNSIRDVAISPDGKSTLYSVSRAGTRELWKIRGECLAGNTGQKLRDDGVSAAQ
jgi:WD40 repeat protein